MAFRGTFSTDSAAAITAAVPEPASWVMLILGFFNIGAGLRGRRHRPFGRPVLICVTNWRPVDCQFLCVAQKGLRFPPRSVCQAGWAE